MNLSLLLRRVPARLFYSCFLLVCFLQVHSPVHASGETIWAIDNSDGKLSPTALGNINPCGTVHFKLTDYTPPGGYSISSIDWYGNGIFQITSSGGNPYETIQVRSNNGAHSYSVQCVVHYSNGTS